MHHRRLLDALWAVLLRWSGERCVQEAGADGVDVNTVRCILERCAASEADDRVLGGNVATGIWTSDETKDAGGIDDPAAVARLVKWSLFNHLGRRRTDTVEDAFDVYIKRLIE
jgi:hypothetical protein